MNYSHRYLSLLKKRKLIEMMFLANEFIMDIFNKSNINIKLKKDKSPVTEADLGTHNILVKKK